MAQATIDNASQDPNFTRWMAEIARYEKDARRWTERSKKIVKRYKDDRKGPADEARTKYNILWSNLQVLLPAVYTKNPVPEVERRFKDEDPVGREASEVLERCLDYCIKTQSFKDIMRAAVLDRFLSGRGVVWVRYVPHFAQVKNDETPAQLSDDVDPAPEQKLAGDPQAAPEETIENEECLVDYVHWGDFGHTVARTWTEVRAVWRIVFLTRAECVQRFGEDVGNAIPLAATDGKDKGDTTVDSLKKAMIYEIWDKVDRTVSWLCKEYPQGLLDQKADPLHLSGFWPCARPLYATLDNETLIPTPDFVLYQDQADEIDTLTARIASVAKAIKVAGVYDASAQGVERLLSEGVENKLIPVDSWAAFAEKGGLQGAIQFLPLKEIAEALLQLYETREKVKQDLYEITGMSDIIRGANDPTETATATRIKGQFASIRLKDRQDEVAEFARDTLRIMGEVMATHFGIETLARISGVDLPTEQQKQQVQASLAPPPPMMGMQPAQPPQPTPDQLLLLQKPTWEQVGQLLQNDAARNFRIDIETDSTIGEDEQQQKEERLEMLKAVSDFLREAIPAIQQNPQMGPLLGQMLMFTLRSFKAGRTLENVFEATMKQLEDAAKQPPKPSAEETKAQAATQQVQAKAQADIQVNQDRIAAEAQQSAQELAQQKELEQFKARLEQETAYREQDAQGRQAAQQIDLEQRRDEQRMAMEERLELRKQEQEQAERAAEAARQHELELAKLADAAQQRDLERYKVDHDNATKLVVAEIQAKASLATAATTAAAGDGEDVPGDAPEAATQPDLAGVMQSLFAELRDSLTQELTRPKTIERDGAGRAISVNGRPVQRDANNRIMGF